MPAKAGIQSLRCSLQRWVPASAGTSGLVSPIQFSNSRADVRHRPYSLRRRVRRSPSRLAPGLFFFPRQHAEGMERQAAHQSSVLPHPLLKDAGASRRSIAAISVPRVRVSWFPSRLLRLVRSASSPHRLVAPWPVRSSSGTVPVQQAPCGAAIVPPDRFPRPPGSGLRAPPAGAAPTGEAVSRFRSA